MYTGSAPLTFKSDFSGFTGTLQANSSSAAYFDLAPASPVTYGGALAGAGDFRLATESLTLNGVSSPFSGNFYVDTTAGTGALTLSAANTLPNANITVNRGTLAAKADRTQMASLVVKGGAVLALGNDQSLQVLNGLTMEQSSNLVLTGFSAGTILVGTSANAVPVADANMNVATPPPGYTNRSAFVSGKNLYVNLSNGAAITKIAPASVSAGGGEVVTLSGVGFTGSTDLKVDGVSLNGVGRAANYTVVSDTELTFVAPPHAAGDVLVELTTSGGELLSASLRYVGTADSQPGSQPGSQPQPVPQPVAPDPTPANTTPTSPRTGVY